MKGSWGKFSGVVAAAIVAMAAVVCVSIYLLSPPTIPDKLLFHDLKGKNVALKTFKGKIGTVVIFTATWCGYCKDEIKAAKPIYEDNAPRGIQFLMVFQDYDAGDIRRYAKVNSIPWPVVQKTDYSMKVFRREGLGVPSAFFLTSDGRVVANLTGRNSTRHYREAIDLLFEEHFK
jgi:thiol-disulfide isomerase/thioredoxin